MLVLDSFCFLAWSSKAKNEIIGIPYIPEPPEVWIVGVTRWMLLSLLVIVLRGASVSLFPCEMGVFGYLDIWWIRFPPLTACVCWSKLLFNILV